MEEDNRVRVEVDVLSDVISLDLDGIGSLILTTHDALLLGDALLRARKIRNRDITLLITIS